jgi:hypothetical protein
MMAGLKRMVRPALVALVLVVVTTNVAAQLEEEFESISPFLGSWDSQITSPGGQDRGSCGGRTGDYGEKLLNCSMPADQLPLNVRGEAWMNYVDLFQSPTTAECAMLSLPAMLGDDFSLTAEPGRVDWTGGQGNARTIWMNGAGPTPRSGQLFQQGYSVGHFEDGEFVIENTNFTFDPDGMDDHLHMASSVRKKVTERYQFIDDDTIRLIITLEDGTFLTRPFTYSKLFTRTTGGGGGGRGGWRSCDPDLSRRELEFAYPGTKYRDEP